MWEAKLHKEWDQAAQICAVVANANRPKNKPPYKAADFHPLRRKKGGGNSVRLTRDNIGVLQSLLKER